jgi:serine/threonine-protein kinase HipA
VECHLQLFHAGTWHDCAVVTALRPEQGGVNSRALFEYDLEYVFGGAGEPVSLAFPVNAANRTLDHWPAFLYDLIPQGAGRKFLLGELRLPDDRSSDFALLCAGAFNPIGCLRVAEAVAYFDAHVDRHTAFSRGRGMSLDEIVNRGEDFVERMMVQGMLAAGTTGVQGAAPKYLLTRDHGGLWHGDGVLPDVQAAEHVIVKLPRGKEAADRKVLRNEAAYMKVAAAMGLRTYGTVRHRDDMLFIPRFDRSVAGGVVTRHHQESAAAVAGLAGFDLRPSQFELLAALRGVLSDKQADTIEFLKRDVLNLAMRNTDNHARNTAVQKIGDRVQLTPLFDFAPMYLGPEGIARVLRWYHPGTRKELVNWGDILDTLEVEPGERDRIRQALAEFGIQLENLTDCMQVAGVDHDIIEHLQPGIDEQRRQLRDLRAAPPGTGAR